MFCTIYFSNIRTNTFISHRFSCHMTDFVFYAGKLRYWPLLGEAHTARRPAADVMDDSAAADLIARDVTRPDFSLLHFHSQ